MVAITLILKLNGLIILFSIIILHIFHFRGSYKINFPPFFRVFTRYERFFLKLMFKLLKSEILYKNRLIRFIPEFISWFAANGARPSVYTLQELERIINILYNKLNFG